MGDSLPSARVDDYRLSFEEQERNRAHYDGRKHVDVCFLCGRGLTERAVARGWWIEMRTDRTLVPNGVDAGEQSQGAFPIGPECAKRVPAVFRSRA